MAMLTFDELVDFIEHRMRMSHIYQPLLIRTLVDTGGTPTGVSDLCHVGTLRRSELSKSIVS